MTVLVLNGCSTVKVYDKEVCGDLGDEGAHCAHTLTKDRRDIPKHRWDEIRVGWLCTDSRGFNDTETAIDQLCRSFSGACDYRTRKELGAAVARIRRVANRARHAGDENRAKVKMETGIDLDTLADADANLADQ